MAGVLRSAGVPIKETSSSVLIAIWIGGWGRVRRLLDVALIFVVGALFEWMTGSRRRAPLWILRARLEWLYRFALEPRRLAKRYTSDVIQFSWIVWRRRREAVRSPPS